MISEKKVTDFPCRQLLSVSPYKYQQCFPAHPAISYGEELVKNAFHCDRGLVETVAHFTVSYYIRFRSSNSCNDYASIEIIPHNHCLVYTSPYGPYFLSLPRKYVLYIKSGTPVNMSFTRTRKSLQPI